MSTTELLVIILTIIALGFSLYRRFNKKNQGKDGTGPIQKSGTSFTSTSPDDDYEPYSKSKENNN